MMTPIEELESVLLAVPEMLHGDIRNHVNDVCIIKTLIEDVIPQWTEEQQVEALDQVEKNEGVYNTVLVKVFCRFKTCFKDLAEGMTFLSIG